MQSKKLICILFFWSCVQAMKAPMERIDASAKHELYIHALHRINAIIDNYLKINKGKDTIIVDDIRLKKPLINEWCRPSKQGLVLEILSKVQFNQHSLRYSIRTPWGLFPLIESNNFAKPLRHELFPTVIVGESSFKGCCFEALSSKYIDCIDKEKCLILQVDDVALISAH